MIPLGSYSGRKVLWVPYEELLRGYVPPGNWICMAISNGGLDEAAFSRWAEFACKNNLLYFWGQGKEGERLHLLFDLAMVDVEIKEGIDIDVCTSGDSEEPLKEVLWQCFYATALPERTDYDSLFVVCTDMNGSDRSEELSQYMREFVQEDLAEGYHPSSIDPN